MVRLSHTAASRQAVLAYSAVTGNAPPAGSEPDSKYIDHTGIARIARECRSRDPRCALDLLLRGTDIYLPKRASKPQPSAEYVAFMEKLRHEQAEKSYASMLNIPEKHDSPHSIAKDISDQISVILNILFSAVFTGLAIWYATANLTTYKHRQPFRVGASITVAVIVAVAEVVLFNSYLRKMDDARSRARQQPEVKSIIPLADPSNAEGSQET
ncbi:Vacuolar ATPase assembly integral membrane protein [Orbilia blumenaviensis]|uniref:Vacuolar ATPase assembly integral membrane protein n=1 Tax=Orbilia blumenaviensis TaxID=1796055 RepID=A0AAV9V1J9_9PEZI